MCERSELRKGLLAITLPGWSVAVSKGVGSKIGVVRPGAYEVNAVLCAKGVWVDGYLSIAHFTACTTVHNGGGRHLRMGGGGGGANCSYACVSTHMLGGSWGMLPRKILQIRCSESASEATFGLMRHYSYRYLCVFVRHVKGPNF